MKKLILATLLILLSLPARALDYPSLSRQLSADELLFLSFADHPEILVDAESVQHLRSYHNQYLREPMYDDYVHVILQKMLGITGFKHLFRNLGGGFVPIRVEQGQLQMKGTRDHCGGMEEALILVDLTSGDVTSVLYSEETFLIHSTLSGSDQVHPLALAWIERIVNAYGTRKEPTRTKQLLRKMADTWCHANSP